MRPRVRRALGVGVAAAVAVTVALPATAAQADDAVAVLQRARTATVREDFSGTVQIEWLVGGGWKSEKVPVSATGGTVQVGEGTRQVEGKGHDRWIAGVSGWQAGWDQPATLGVPSPAKHWKLSVAKGPYVSGRTTTVVTATDPRTHVPRLRESVDRATGVLLRREVLDRAGRPVRAVGFVEVQKLGGPRSTPPTTPARARRSAPRAPKLVGALPSGYVAPRTVADRYVLTGRYERADGTAQLYYTDGLFGVSVFEQDGDLDWAGLPKGGGANSVLSGQGREYQVAGGTVEVWSHDGVTRTLVSDLPAPDLSDFARAFDARSDAAGGLLGDAADFLLGPFGWR